jgi:type I restriction enzyme R subunit
MRSTNFDHLKPVSEQLFRLGFLAERFFAEDPNTSPIKSRQFAETLIEVAARTGACWPEACRGKRLTQDPNDESASVRLRRRRAAGAAAPKTKRGRKAAAV